MKTISNLTGVVNEDGVVQEQRGAPFALVLEVDKGIFVHAFLGPAGLRFRGAKWKDAEQRTQVSEVGIPMEAVMALLREKAPELFRSREKANG